MRLKVDNQHITWPESAQYIKVLLLLRITVSGSEEMMSYVRLEKKSCMSKLRVTISPPPKSLEETIQYYKSQD